MQGKGFCDVRRFVVLFLCVGFGLQFVGGCRKDVPEQTNDEVSQVPEAVVEAKIDDMASAVAAVGDWPWRRGPGGDNVCEAGQNPPTKWSETENILWKVELAGKGHATPCVYGARIYLASGDKKQESIWMQCLDRETGNEVWRTEVYQGKMAKIHGDNSYGSAMPACDGERVYFPYQTGDEVRMVAMDLAGEIVWDELLTPYTSIQGFSASPALYKSAVIVVVDGKENNKLTALHRKTGKVIWQSEVEADHESYASAVVFDVAGRMQVILVGPDHVRSYDPDNGEHLWQCDGPAMCCVAVAVADDKMVYATGGFPKKALFAIDASGSGNVTETHLVWKGDDKSPYVPSPLLADGLLYAVNDKGLFRCYEAADGKILWEEKLDGNFYSSPVLVGERIYVFNRKGKGFVLKAGREYELVAENELEQGAFATPVICRGRILLRTMEALYCLGESEN